MSTNPGGGLFAVSRITLRALGLPANASASFRWTTRHSAIMGGVAMTEASRSTDVSEPSIRSTLKSRVAGSA